MVVLFYVRLNILLGVTIGICKLLCCLFSGFVESILKMSNVLSGMEELIKDFCRLFDQKWAEYQSVVDELDDGNLNAWHRSLMKLKKTIKGLMQDFYYANWQYAEKRVKEFEQIIKDLFVFLHIFDFIFQIRELEDQM